nr:lysophospholipid acyltransferase family protein [Chthonobacter albigriseus]
MVIPVQMLALRFGWRLSHRLPIFFHRFACRVLGVRVTVRGTPETGRPLLIAANHVSWLDIVVIGSLFPVCFIAKSEVATWPLFGSLARLQRTVFVERERRSKTQDQAREIAERLSDGDAMVLFAEGTTGDGNMLLPFRSSLIGAARAAIDAGGHSHVLVQPVAVAYTRLQGLPMGRQWRPLVSWIGDIELPPHLMQIAREGAVDVTVLFGEPISFDRDGDRKRVTAQAEASVRLLLAETLRTGG